MEDDRSYAFLFDLIARTEAIATTATAPIITYM
jgi:hypothetical protein